MINFAEMTIEQLQNVHSEMLATASDLGFQAPDETLVEFDTLEAGRVACDRLHAAIEKFRKKAVAPAKEKAQATALPDTAKGRKLKKAAESSESAKPESENTDKEKAVAKTATKKVLAKKAKAAPAKGKKKVAGSSARRPAFDENKKITWTYKGEGSGCREGSAKHERHDLVRKCSGQTVKSFLAKEGVMVTLLNCVAQGKAKVA